MISLLVIGDGARDSAVLPHLIAAVLGSPIQPTTRQWSRLNKPSGYDKKLLYHIREACDLELNGVVAVVDADRDRAGNRMRALRAGRENHRAQHAPVPTALGCADPHGEAWLLDDPVAVRTGLKLPATTPVPTVRNAIPKDALEALHRESPERERERTDVWGSIAAAVVMERCDHSRETGFPRVPTRGPGRINNINGVGDDT
jgi:hypothetical protein